MARIRTIKPEFFTSEDIVSLSPMARLLYIATWCEADKEGRLNWKPRTFKLRYFPADDCDIDALARELVASGLVIPYGDALAYIPNFAKHQHLNPRESASILPEPDASARVGHASARDSDAQGGREGKGREGKDKSAESLPPAAAFDFKADLFARWKAVPGSGGGAFLNKLYRDHKPDDRVTEAVERTLSETRADPKAFVLGVLKAPRPGSVLDDDYESALAIVRAQDFSGCI